MKRLLLLLAALSISGCNLDTAPPDQPTDPATESFDPSLGVNIATMTRTASGAYWKDIKVGTGATLSGTPQILFTYAGYLKTGASFGAGAQTVPYPVANLIYGVQEGMQGMKVAGQRLIVVPSSLGYGPNVAGSIPANSTLIFQMQLDAIP